MRKSLRISLATALVAAVAPISAGAQAPPPPTCRGEVATIVGTSAGEVIHGTPGNDVIVARGGNDVVYAGAGNDIVCGNGGADRLYGGFGWDDLNGDHGHDQLYGGNGRDRLAGGTGADRLWGHDGDDRLLGGDHDDMILSGLGNDTAFGGGDDDTVAGGPGDDLLRGDAGNDIVTGGFGNDRIYGGVGADDLDGGGDDDVLFSGPDDVSVEGGPGNDVCAVGCEEDDSSVDPIAVDDVATTDEDTPVTIDVLSNDIDPDSDLTVASVSDTALGATVEIAADGGVRYTPPADVSGTDTFSYNVTDGFDSDTATVTVTIDAVNDAPNALDDTVSTVEDQSVEIGVLANDVDVDSNLTVTGVSDVSDGAEVEIGEDSRLRYTPPADWNGTDTFTYTMSDGELTDTATVTVNVAAANDSPMAQDDTATTDEDQSIAIDVIANDTDTDNAELALTGVSESTALGGTVVRGETPNTVLYTPPADTSGTDTFTYTVTDGEEIDTGMVTVTINPVNDPPVAEDDGFVTEEDTPVQLDPLDNDRDIDSEIFLLSADAETEFGGTLEVTKGGAVDYTPPENEFGTDSFSYTVSDGEFEDTATVNIQIFEVNDAPEARDDTANTDEDTAVDIDVFGNDSDVESPVSDLRITAVSETERGGRVETQEVGVLRYEPPSNVNGEDSFTYTVTDGEDTATARVTVLIAAIDDPPIAGDDEAATDEDVAVEIDVLANDTEFDGSPLSVSEVRESSLGAEVVVTDSGKLL